MKIKFNIVYLLLILSLNVFGQQIGFDDSNYFYVNGDGWAIKGNKPVSWITDIESAESYAADIVFYRSREELKNGSAIIQVLIFKKQDENTIEDLKSDIKNYRKKYLDLSEKELQIKLKGYKCYSKIISIENMFTQYISYVNPGKEFNNGFSVAMNIQNREASDEEFETFKRILGSIKMTKM